MMTMVHVQQAGRAACLQRSPCPQGVMLTGLYGFLDTEWASCVTGQEYCAREFCCVLLRIVQTCSMSQRETLLQPSRLPAANSTPEKWPGQSERGPCILAKTSRMCWSLREYGRVFLNTFYMNSHGKVTRVKFENVKKKKKEQDIGTDYRLYNPIWSHLPTPSLWRNIHSLVNVWFLERYTKTLLEMGMGNLNIKETFILLCIIPFALLLWTCLFFKS